MTSYDPTRRLALAALMLTPAAIAGCAQAQDDADLCPDLVGRVARFIGPNDAVTMDYNPERVNIHHDEEFRITRIDYG